MSRWLVACASSVAALAAGCSGVLDVADTGGGGDSGADGSVSDPCDRIVCPGEQSCVAGRCRDADACAGVTCGNPGEVCDPRDGACHPGATDSDGDGYTLADGDCDDGDPAIHPGALELCDGVDQDCDLEVDEGFADADGDGFDICGFGVPGQADCDDADPTRSPGAVERCDGVDRDCNGEVDDGLGSRSCETSCGVGLESCVGGAWVCSPPAGCECSPAGSTERQGCGSCGSRERTCGADLRWSEWTACFGEGECAAGSTESRGCGACSLGSQARTCGASCSWGAWSTCVGGGTCEPGTVETLSCGECGTESRTCQADCSWGAFAPCLGTRSCPWGHECRSDGDCECGPYPHFRLVGASCRPSCGAALDHEGLENVGAGCCAAGCLGAETEPTWDCVHCCQNPPGCS